MSEFRNNVLSVVRSIPKGSVLTYREVAEKAGSPHAARAVGVIMKANYDPAIPCHRVIRSDGSLGEYNRGKDEKERKLKLEGYVRT
jgi:O-6-methylguanine DNA methyltransferase